MKSLLPFVIVFALLIGLAVYLGNSDPITPAVVEARSQIAAGPVTMNVLNDGLAFLAKLLGGVAMTSLIGFAMVEGAKWYRRFRSEKLTRRGPWRPGLNANFQEGKAPKVTREDLLLMALSQGQRLPRVQRSMQMPREEVNDELDLDF